MASFPGFKYRKQILMNNTNRTSTKNIQYSTLFLNVALILKANTDNGIFDETRLSQNITADIYICRPGRLNTIDYNNPGLGFFFLEHRIAFNVSIHEYSRRQDRIRSHNNHDFGCCRGRNLSGRVRYWGGCSRSVGLILQHNSECSLGISGKPISPNKSTLPDKFLSIAATKYSQSPENISIPFDLHFKIVLIMMFT